ncbi:thioesterase family protein [Solimonas sp. K1W22B-7]|uniref:acyl-CoA thioesterase n=1 Tax=Solimonas sp. K1W22B-7 TaxID=2303331 RepID=UPI000E32D6D3|nr:thioesterase family protein [Solimonas sp. K1W22B-7]AXQ28633.1 thioesterase family protein [Solimonas sp. K1W22B-7]
MRFSEILQAMTGSGGDWSASVGEEWLQGRTVFGGLQAAIAVRAMRALVPAETPLRTLQTSFIAPVGPGTVRVQARVLRTGKSATQVEARIHDGEQVACTVLGIFGSARESAVNVGMPYPEVPKDFDGAREIPFIPGATPVFTKNVRMRWARGTFPFMGSTEPVTQIYVSLRDEPACDELTVIGLADIIPSPGLSLLQKPAMASSLTWTLELLSTQYEATAADPFLVDARVVSASEGYINHSTTLWSPARRAIALSSQTVVVFG